MRHQQSPRYPPTPARNVFRGYAVICGLVGLALFLWVPMRYGGRFAAGPFEGATEARVFGALFMAMAACAAALSVVNDTQVRHRSLFWFALGHIVLWLVVLCRLMWVGADTMVGVLGMTAFMLFYFWLSAEGEFPTAMAPVNTGIFGRPVESWRRPVSRSQYEQKIRQAGAQEERNRLARDLHDSIKQQIFAIQTAAATAQTRLAGDGDGTREALNQIRGAAREAMTEMEVMLDQLRAEPLENTGLVEALKKLCESIGFRTGAPVEFKLGVIPPANQMAPGAAEATLRAAQEALSNVARHARAYRVFVSLDSNEDWMELTVRDDGAGFDPNQASGGMGTANMRRRAEEFGGTFELDSHPGRGTTVKFSIPCETGSRSNYRNRVIALGLLLTGMFLSDVTHHWSIAPAVAFVAAIGVIHYVKAYWRVRKSSETAP